MKSEVVTKCEELIKAITNEIAETQKGIQVKIEEIQNDVDDLFETANGLEYVAEMFGSIGNACNSLAHDTCENLSAVVSGAGELKTLCDFYGGNEDDVDEEEVDEGYSVLY